MSVELNPSEMLEVMRKRLEKFERAAEAKIQSLLEEAGIYDQINAVEKERAALRIEVEILRQRAIASATAQRIVALEQRAHELAPSSAPPNDEKVTPIRGKKKKGDQ